MQNACGPMLVTHETEFESTKPHSAEVS
jgi:hypothetical protein